MATDRLFNQSQGDSLIAAVTALQSRGFSAAQITTLLSTLSGTNTALDAIRAAIASTSRGSVVSVSPAQSSGQAVGTVRVDNVDFPLFSLPTVARTQAALSSVADILAGQDAEKTATGNPVTITAKAAPVRALAVEIDAVQSGSGDPSPTNLRPISGWTAATITRSGENLCPGIATQIINGVQWTLGTDGTTTALRTNTDTRPSQPQIYVKLPLSAAGLELGKTYTLSGCPSGGRDGADGYFLRAIGYKEDGTSIANLYTDFGAGVTFTVPATWTYMTVFAHYGANITQSLQFKPMLRAGSGSFVPYQGQSATVSFGSAGTVYGGALDVLAGTLTVTHGNIASYNRETLPGEWISDRDVYAAGTVPTTGAQVVYELATPLTYTLNPAQLSTRGGTNVIAADCGPVAVRYIADISGEIADLRTKINALGGA